MKWFCTLRLLLFLPLFYLTAHAQQKPIRLESLSLDDGISYQTVYAIHQDSRGFLWIGTMSGLVRYDGYRNTVFRHDPAIPGTLSHDDIVSIFEDSKKKLWIGTYGGGLNRYDPDTQSFERFVHDSLDSSSLNGEIVWSIGEDDEGKIWVGTQGEGLNVLDPSRPNLGFSHYRRDQADPSHSAPLAVQKIHKSRDGKIWFGTFGRGLCEFLREGRTFTYYPMISRTGDTIQNYQVFDIAEIGGELWLATNLGLKIWNQKHKIWSERIPTSCDKILSSGIGKICMDPSGRLWIGTFGQGLLRVDTVSWTVAQTKRNFADPFSLKSDVVTALFQDQSGLMWVGTASGGLQKNTPDHYKFGSIANDPTQFGTLSDDNINTLLVTGAGIWVGSNAGLDLIRRDGSIEKKIHHQIDQNVQSTFAVTALWQDPDGSVWAGSFSRGLFHQQSGRWKNYRMLQKDTSPLSDKRISAIHRDRTGTLWIGTFGGGLHQLNEQDDRFICYDRDNSALPNNDILCMTETSDSSVWVGTYGGLLRIPRHGSWKLYRKDATTGFNLPDNYVYALTEDRLGKLWIGTNRGLCYFDFKTGQFHAFYQKNGLPSDVISGIVEDASGMLWISTQKGISRFDYKQMLFRNYDRSDGLVSNMFNRGVCAKDANGKIYFGGIGGVNVVDPKRIHDNEFAPQVQVVGFRKFDVPMAFRPGETTELTYDDNFFTIAFSSMDFYAPEKNKFQFRLEPLEKSWRPAGLHNEASYTNIEPGTYIFHVRGSNRDGYWSPHEASLTIIIHPPFWKTKLFIIVMTVIMILIIWAAYKTSTRRKIQHALALERVRISERDNMREQISKDFHDELGHKLTKISLFSELSRRAMKKDLEESSVFLEKVTEASSSLSVNTRDFIWVLDPGKDTLYDVIVNLRDFAYELFDKTGIEFRLHGMTESLEHVRLSMDWRRHLTLIFKEALTNILKHAHAKKVTLYVNAEGEKIEISLQDDGRGFETHSTDESRNGLRNMRARAKRLRGNIFINSSLENGTCIRFEGNLKLPDSHQKKIRRDWIHTVRSWFV